MMHYDSTLQNRPKCSFEAIQEENDENSTWIPNFQCKTPALAGGYESPYLKKKNQHENTRKINRSDVLKPLVLNTESELLKKNALPFVNSFGKEGRIFSRTSSRALILRRWTESYWLHIHPTTILVFKSKNIMDEWKGLKDDRESIGFSVADCQKREKHIDWMIDFDTSGIVYNKMMKSEKKKCKRMNISPPDLKSKVIDNTIPPILYAMEDVRSKYYDGRKGSLLHTCKISYLSTGGRTLAAAFGSTEPSELKRLRATIRYCFKLVTKYTKKAIKREYSDHCEEMVVGSSNTFDSGSTLLSGVGYSVVASDVSTTVYGRRTMTRSALACEESTD